MKIAPNVTRRCIAHYELRCQEPECLYDEWDLENNASRKRPSATPGAPEVSKPAHVKPHNLPVSLPEQRSPLPVPTGAVMLTIGRPMRAGF